MKRVSGTREWAKSNENCMIGCSHECRYCYARYNAVDRFKLVPKGTWGEERIDGKKLGKGFGRRRGTIMFPTTHDITPGNLATCLDCLKRMLAPGNDVLIVSKPHLECIEVLCDELVEHRDRILFRFTIGAKDNGILRYWEPGAPPFEERLDSLMLAHHRGFATSVSMEPVLDWPNVVGTFHLLAPFVTDAIWVGMLNDIDRRVKVETEEDERMVRQMREWQIEEVFWAVHERLKDHPLIKWKESLKKVFGLEIPEEAGLDI